MTRKSAFVKCSPSMSFQECELAILRTAVDAIQQKQGQQQVNSPEVQQMIQIVEEFLRDRQLVCYGGQSINEELPEDKRFYNKDVDIPDYDFYSPRALQDAKDLADIFAKKGYTEVEAKSGQHHGTYKLFVNFIPIADISYLPKEIFDTLQQEAISIQGILYAPPNFLRMAMYLELSRPMGDVSRFEKVLRRLALLNETYPITCEHEKEIDFQRSLDEAENKEREEEIFRSIQHTLVQEGCVFFGGYAATLYSRYMPTRIRKKLHAFPDFDVLSNTPKHTALKVKENLAEQLSIPKNKIKILHHAAIGEIVPENYEIKIGRDTVAFLFQTVACHSYNILKIQDQPVKVATIDTMLSFYLAFLYVDDNRYKQLLDRILCMSKFLFDVQQKNRLKQRGLLKRFTMTCIGHQPTVEEMRAEKAAKYRELKAHPHKHKELEEWFLNYKPTTLATNPKPKTKPKPKPKPKTKAKTKRRKQATTRRKDGWLEAIRF